MKLAIPTVEVDWIEYIASKVGFSSFITLYFAIVDYSRNNVQSLPRYLPSLSTRFPTYFKRIYQ
jgi:hypothetical protein